VKTSGDIPEGASVDVQGHDETEEYLEDPHVARADIKPILHNTAGAG
jgi:hypothetical protein